ncbi:MAG: hypothetical protein ACRC2K_12995 [Clostridium sp.]
MRKVLISFIMITTTLCTVYTVVFWQPSLITENINKSNVTKIENNQESMEKKSFENIQPGKSNIKEKVDSSKNSNNKSAISSNIVLLKMSKEEILDSLSITDKFKLGKYAYKLQEIDRNRIIEWMTSGNEIEGAQKSYKLIKSRLSTEDFTELQRIITPYVNMELLKQEI